VIGGEDKVPGARRKTTCRGKTVGLRGAEASVHKST